MDEKQIVDLLESLKNGVDLGIDIENNPPSQHPNARNPPSDEGIKCGLSKTIHKWYNRNQLLGPFTKRFAKKRNILTHPIFGIYKPDGSVRPVINYSHPKSDWDTSLNGHIDENLRHVDYVAFQSIVATVASQGTGAFIWTRDLEDGFFNCSLRETQIPTVGFLWADRVWVPTVMTFGLSSAPKIFTDFMTTPMRAIRNEVAPIAYNTSSDRTQFEMLSKNEVDCQYKYNCLTYPLIRNYMDDIIGVHRNRVDAHKQFTATKRVLKRLNLAPKISKDQYPKTRQKVLGLILDTRLQRVFLPQDKLQRYLNDIKTIKQKKTVTQLKLLGLIGRIRHSAIALRALHSFARNLELWAYAVPKLHHHLNVTSPFKADLDLVAWALQQAAEKGTPFEAIIKPRHIPDITAYTDAASIYGGIGGYIHRLNGEWFQQHWDEIDLHNKDRDIHWKELTAIAVLIRLYKHKFRHKRVTIYCDNEAVVYMLINFRANLKRPDLQAILRYIAKELITFNIQLWINHIAGADNITADAMSRFYINPTQYSSIPLTASPSNALRATQYFSDLCKDFEIERQYLKFN